ncbi:hypothetical protein BsWGS_28405 [Bradybaena similaris]
MSWSEDTWEDIADPPLSPISEDVFRDGELQFYDHQLSQESASVNGPPSTTDIPYSGNQNPHAPAAQDAGPTWNTSLASVNKTTAGQLATSNGSHSSKDHSNQQVPRKKTAANGKLKLRPNTDMPNNRTNSQAAVSLPKSFKAGGKSVRADSKSGSKSRLRTTEDEHNPGGNVDGSSVGRQVNEHTVVPSALGPVSVSPGSGNSQLRSNESISSSREFKESELMSSASDGSEQYSQVNPRNSRSSRTYTLHEYEKDKELYREHLLGKYSLYHNGDRNHEDGLKVGEDEETINAVMCIVFCVMGVGVFIGLICVLIHFSSEKEQNAAESPMHWENNYDTWLNSLYSHRVADVIRTVSLVDQHRLRPDTTTPLAPRTDLLQMCGIHPPDLVGNTTDVNLNITLDINDIISNNSDVLEGGEWRPPSCISRHRIAVIIPYRDRFSHLKVLLHYLIPLLKRQQIHFRIFVVEQFGNDTFNKGRIMNAAFRESLKLFNFHCVCFHDVDLVPENDRNMYSCTEQPKHMSIGIDKFQYILPYDGLVGGVLMFKTEQFVLVNGYSNMYWGWGAEDDDMTTRILSHGLRIYRPPSNIARYKMVKHDGRKSSEVSVRMKLLRSAAKRSKLEGLNNAQYKLVSTHIERLFTHFIVDIGHP